MSLADLIQRGTVTEPPRILLYGLEGLGKSTLGACAPKPVFLPTEDGLAQIGPDRFPLARNLGELFHSLDVLTTESHEYSTVVVDTLDWAEKLIHAQVCADFGVKLVEHADRGFQRGFVHALNYWRELVDRFSRLRERGMAILLLAHSRVEKFEDPMSPSYDRYSPRLHKTSTALLSEWADAVLFATRRFRLDREDRGFGKERVIAQGLGDDGGERIIRTSHSPSAVAKNRYGLPPEISFSSATPQEGARKFWEVFFSHLEVPHHG